MQGDDMFPAERSIAGLHKRIEFFFGKRLQYAGFERMGRVYAHVDARTLDLLKNRADLFRRRPDLHASASRVFHNKPRLSGDLLERTLHAFRDTRDSRRLGAVLCRADVKNQTFGANHFGNLQMQDERTNRAVINLVIGNAEVEEVTRVQKDRPEAALCMLTFERRDSLLARNRSLPLPRIRAENLDAFGADLFRVGKAFVNPSGNRNMRSNNRHRYFNKGFSYSPVSSFQFPVSNFRLLHPKRRNSQITAKEKRDDRKPHRHGPAGNFRRPLEDKAQKMQNGNQAEYDAGRLQKRFLFHIFAINSTCTRLWKD